MQTIKSKPRCGNLVLTSAKRFEVRAKRGVGDEGYELYPNIFAYPTLKYVTNVRDIRESLKWTFTCPNFWNGQIILNYPIYILHYASYYTSYIKTSYNINI